MKKVQIQWFVLINDAFNCMLVEMNKLEVI